IQLPAAGDRCRHAACGKPLTLAEWQFPVRGGYPSVGPVKIRHRFVPGELAGHIEADAVIAVARVDAEGLRPRVRGCDKQAAREASCYIRLQRVVPLVRHGEKETARRGYAKLSVQHPAVDTKIG